MTSNRRPIDQQCPLEKINFCDHRIRQDLNSTQMQQESARTEENNTCDTLTTWAPQRTARDAQLAECRKSKQSAN